ncbi:hypothetical protein AB0L05_30470 [Nonomuraea pusilla]|uniref:hypothetical protein n=1 Tax=Nonomuraea pusilla TaxID=46177 RepID=UPI003321CCA8
MSLGGMRGAASTITVVPPPDRPPPGAATGAVTLITGDRVIVTGASVRVEPGPGRQTGFTRQVIEGHLNVIPYDARPLLA